MQTEYLPYQFNRASRLCQTELTDEARERLHAIERFELARERGLSSSEAAQVVGYPRATLYRWRKRYETEGPAGLASRSRKPKHLRQRQWPQAALRKLTKLRKEFPAWGKKKLARLMQKAGYDFSTSTIGRMLAFLVERGTIQAVHTLIGKRKLSRRKAKRAWAKRLKRGERLRGKKPGEAIQLDTLTVNMLSKIERKHFNAVCTVSKWNVAAVYERATANNAARFLDLLEEEMPFPIKGLQIDGGSEFMAEFETACAEKGIPLYVLAPKSPELNGGVERINRTWRDEFYDLYDDLPHQLSLLRPELKEQQFTINWIRPHEALDLLAPIEYLRANYPDLAPQSQM